MLGARIALQVGEYYCEVQAMFERYTEKARRAIFFARYEASQFGSDFINLEHLLLGLLREDPCLVSILGNQGVQAVRQYVVDHSPPFEKSPSTSIDLPLDLHCRCVLEQVAAEAEALNPHLIDSCHLVLGLLRTEESLAAEALLASGIDYRSYRDMLAKLPLLKAEASIKEILQNLDVEPQEPNPLGVAAPALREDCMALACLVDRASPELKAYSEADAFCRLGRGDWIRKVALGHLIDWACAHQQWFARALTEPKIAVFGYPVAEWVTAQKYREYAWSELTNLWLDLNRLLVHVIAQVPETKLGTPCRIGLDEPISFERLIANYVKFCQDEMAEILKRRKR